MFFAFIVDPDAFRFSRPDDADLVLNAGSNDYFSRSPMESIGFSIRLYFFWSSHANLCVFWDVSLGRESEVCFFKDSLRSKPT